MEDAPWPATKDELIDYAQRSGAPLEVIENLQEMEDEGEIYECMEDIWPDYPSKEDFFFNEEEYWLSASDNPHRKIIIVIMNDAKLQQWIMHEKHAGCNVCKVSA